MLCKKSNLLNGINDAWATVTTDLRTEYGTMLIFGLPKDAPVNIRPTCHLARTNNDSARVPFLP
jgi:hypothetical protein